MMEGRTACVILLSGGLDSTACVHYYLNQGFDVEGIFVDYGQKAREKELSSARTIASHYGIKFSDCECGVPREHGQGEIVGRNAFLVFAALLARPEFRGIICLGIHSGVPYYDCSEVFARNLNRLLEGYTDGQVVLDTPFLRWDKRMILEYCKDNNVPIQLTYSCEVGSDPPCGKCMSCCDRRALDVGEKA